MRQRRWSEQAASEDTYGERARHDTGDRLRRELNESGLQGQGDRSELITS